MSHEHHHHHHEVEGKNLFFTILLNAIISLAELIGGIIASSISLISDSIHNFSDVLSLIVSFVANKLTKQKANEKRTFGYKRSEIIAAFFNSTTLIVLAFYIIYEAVVRFIHPVKTSGMLIIWLALGSIVVNGLSVLFIKNDAHENMNMKSAYLHLFGDMITSIAVLIGGILIKFFHIYWIDPVFSVLIAIYLLYMSWDIFKSSLKIMMQFTPDDIDIQQIASDIQKFKNVKNIHHIHIWQINEHDIMFEAHVDIDENIKIADIDVLFQKIKNYLHSEYDIHHVTLQPEFLVTDTKELIFN